MQAYSKELFELYASGAIKIQIWKDGYPFTAEGMKQAHDDLCKQSWYYRVLLLYLLIPLHCFTFLSEPTHNWKTDRQHVVMLSQQLLR